MTLQREGIPEPFDVSIARQQMEGGVRHFSVYDVYEDREGSVWFGLWWGALGNGDIVRYTPSTAPDGTGTWRRYTAQDGLDIGAAPDIVQTRDGDIWTSSWNSRRGVNRFDGESWTSFRLSDLGGSNRNASAEVKAFYMAMGRYDMVVIVEAPDDATIARLALAVGRTGAVRTETLRAFTEEEYRGIIAALP